MNNYIIKNLLHYKLKTNLSVLSMEKAENMSDIDNQQPLENQIGFLKEQKTIQNKLQKQYDKVLNTSLKSLFKFVCNNEKKDGEFQPLDLTSKNKYFMAKIQEHSDAKVFHIHDYLEILNVKFNETIEKKCNHIALPMEKLLKIPFNWAQTHATSLSNSRELYECSENIYSLLQSMFTTNLSYENSDVDQMIKDQQKILDKLKNSNEKNIEHMQTTQQKIDSVIKDIQNYNDSNEENIEDRKNNKEIDNNLGEWEENNTIDCEPEMACKIYLKTFEDLQTIYYYKRDKILQQQKVLEHLSKFKTEKHQLLKQLEVNKKKLVDKYTVLAEFVGKAFHPNKSSNVLSINYVNTPKKDIKSTHGQNILTIFQHVFGVKYTTFLSPHSRRIEEKSKQYKDEINRLKLKEKQAQHPLEFGIKSNISMDYYLFIIRKYFKDQDHYINSIVRCENDQLLNEIVSLIATTCAPTETLWDNKLKAIVRFLAKQYIKYSDNNTELAMELSTLVIFFHNSFYENKNKLYKLKKLLLSNDIEKLETINQELITNLKKLQDTFEEIKNNPVNDHILKCIIKPFLKKLYDQQNFILNYKQLLEATIAFIEGGLQDAFAEINKPVNNDIKYKNALQKYKGGLKFMYSYIFNSKIVFDNLYNKIGSKDKEICHWDLEKILNLTEDNLTNIYVTERIMFFMTQPLNDQKYYQDNYYEPQKKKFITSIESLKNMFEDTTEEIFKNTINFAITNTMHASLGYLNTIGSLKIQRHNIINAFNLIFKDIQQINSSHKDLCSNTRCSIYELENCNKEMIKIFKKFIADIKTNKYFETQEDYNKYSMMENCPAKEEKISRAKKHVEFLCIVKYILVLMGGQEQLIEKEKKYLQCVETLGYNLNKLLCEKNVGKKVVTEINKHFISFLKYLYGKKESNDQNNNLHKIKNNSLSNDVREKTDADFILSHKDLVSSIKKGLIAEQERTSVFLQQQYKHWNQQIKQIESMIEKSPFIKSKKEKIDTQETIEHFKNIYQNNLSNNERINTHSKFIEIMFENSFLTEDCKFYESYREVDQSIKQQQDYNKSEMESIKQSKTHCEDIEHNPINRQFLPIIERLFNICNCVQNILQKQTKILNYISQIKNLSLRKEEFNEETLTKEYNKLLELLFKHIALDVRITKS